MNGHSEIGGLNTISTSSSSTFKVDKENKKLKDLCNDFESIFVAQMLKTMRGTVTKSELLDGGFSEDVYKTMLDEQFADNLAQNDKSGPGKALYEQLSGKIRR